MPPITPPITHPITPPRCCSVMHDMKNCKVVAGAIIEGDPEVEGTDGNAGEWINMTLMLEEVRAGAKRSLF